MPWKWDEASKERLRTLWAEGYSAAVIAGMLSQEFKHHFERNAIIGARNRWIEGGERKPRLPTIGKPKSLPRPYRVRKRIRHPVGEQESHVPTCDPRALWNLENWHCHFPVQGEGMNTLFCGSRRYQYGEHGGINRTVFPYCYFHCRMAYKKFNSPPPEVLDDAA